MSRATRRLGAALLGLGALTLMTPAAHADVIEGIDLRQDASGATVELSTPDALFAPRVRTSDGVVRLWFPHIDNHLRVERQGDGDAILSVSLHPGMDGSAALTIWLGDSRRLLTSSVEVHQVPGIVRVHLDADLLPAARDTTPDRAEGAAASPDAPAALARAAEADDRPAEQGIAAAAAPAAQGAAPEAAPDTPLSRHTAHGVGQPATALAGSAKGSSGVLLLVSLLLALVYGVLRLVVRRPAGKPRPSIEIVSSKRLGARHQLLVVRALGEDHLLSVHSGETARLASVPSPLPEEHSKEHAPEAPEARPPFAAALLEQLRTGLGLPVHQRTNRRRANATPGTEEGGRFGAHLMRAAASVSYGRAAPNISSESVAGLIRLRERSEG